MSLPVLIVNGPNLNLLGTREPEIYGTETLKDIETKCCRHAKELGLSVAFFQSNHEGELIERLHAAGRDASALIINAGAFSHTSVALLDAIKPLKIPIIEVHLSNIYQREEFRHHSYISHAADGVICGFGSDGYLMALSALKRELK